MDAAVWIFLPLFTAAGSAILAFFVMQARLEVAVSREREQLAEARATIESGKRSLEAQLKATEEEAKRRSFDEFMADLRVEERHYIKESRSLFMNRKAMVLQERLYFRNLPLSSWVNQEFTVDEGSDLERLARSCSLFSTRALPPHAPGNNRLIESHNPSTETSEASAAPLP